MSHETQNITVRMPVDRQRQIDAIAQRADRSRNWIINRAIETYLALYEGEMQQAEAGLARVQNDDDTLTRHEEIKANAQGATLVDHWRHYGLIGSRPDIEDSQSHARQLR